MIDGNVLRKEIPEEISEQNLYKVLSRLCESGYLHHLGKGIYCHYRNTKFGSLPISEEELIKHYVSKNQGVIIGYRLYNRKGITTKISKSITLLSKKLSSSRKRVGNLEIHKLDFPLNDERIYAIETLEILQAYSKIEDASFNNLFNYMKSYCKKYSDEETTYVLKKRKYKKSTIAFLKYFLDSFSINNSLGKCLSPLSDYNIPIEN